MAEIVAGNGEKFEYVELPVEIERKMKLWRLGVDNLPGEFISFHQEVARKYIAAKLSGYNILKQEMKNAGDGDGMMVLCLIVEHKSTGTLHRLKWHPGTCQQEFFEDIGAGSIRFTPKS